MSHWRPLFTTILLLMLNGCLQSSNANLGKACTLGFDAGSSQAAYNPQAPECAGDLCVKPVLQSYSDAYETGPYCTTTCASDSDCTGQRRNGEDPNDHRCSRGFTCGVAFTVGPLCCKKVCLCKDFLDDRGVAVPSVCKPGADGRTVCEDR